MGRRVWIIVGAGLVAVAVIWFSRGTDSPPSAGEPGRAAVVLAPKPAPPEDASSGLDIAADVALVPVTAAPDQSAALADAPRTPAPTDATWVAMLRRQDGSPAAGVPWTFEGEWSPFEWSGPESSPPSSPQSGETDAQGRLAVSFRPTPGALRVLRVVPSDAAPLGWYGADRDVGVHDLGATTLFRGATVSGHVVDGAGHPLPAGVHVSVRRELPIMPLEHVSRQAENESTETDASGSFALRDVEPGQVSVMAYVPATRVDCHQSVELIEGAAATVDLVFDGPAVDRRIVLDVRPASRARSHLGDGVAEFITLRGGSIEPRHPVSPDGWMFLVFDDVPPGTYSLEVSDPAFDVWRRDDVQPGAQVVNVRLQGNTSLEVQAVDACTGQPVETFGVALQSDDRSRVQMVGDVPRFLSSTWWAHPVPKAPHANGRVVLEGLEANPHAVHVEAPGYVAWDTVWMGVEPHGRGTVVARLQPAGRLAGVVVDEAGSPQAGVKVGLFDAPPDGVANYFLDEDEYWAFEPSQGRTSQIRAQAVSDEAGHFELGDTPDGRYVARAWRSPACDAVTDVLELDGSASPEPLRLVLPAAHELSGRVSLPEAVPAERLTLLAVQTASPPGEAAAAGAARRRAPLVASLDAQGHFRFAQATAGTWDVWLTCSVARYLDVGPDMPEWVGDYARRVATLQVPAPDESFITPAAADTPGMLQLRVTGDGVQFEGLDATVYAVDGKTALASAKVSADGNVLLGPLWPGPVRVEVGDPGGRWLHVDPARLSVPSGAVGVGDVILDIATGELRLLDAATGEPRPSAVFALYRRAGDGWAWDLGRSGADGRVALMRPAGELRVLLVPDGDLLMQREGEDWPEFFARRAAAQRIPMVQANELPGTPPPEAVLIDWRPGLGTVDVRL